jgi:hypothetical protein
MITTTTTTTTTTEVFCWYSRYFNLIWFDRRHSSTDRSIRSIEEQYSTVQYSTRRWIDQCVCVGWLILLTKNNILSFFYWNEMKWNEMKWLCFRFVASCLFCFVLFWLQCGGSGFCFFEPKKKKTSCQFRRCSGKFVWIFEKKMELPCADFARYYGTPFHRD